MKKILSLVLVLVASATFTYAMNPRDYKAFSKMNDKAAYTALINYIDADQEQTVFLKNVFNVTAKEINNAVKNGNEALAESVVDYNLRNTRCVLTEDQYKKYLVFVNVYLNNDNDFALVSENK